MDTLPHNCAAVPLTVCGVAHRQPYPDLFAMTLMKVAMGLLAVFLCTVFGLMQAKETEESRFAAHLVARNETPLPRMKMSEP